MMLKIFYGFVGLIAGVITIPMAVFVWPFFLAYFMFSKGGKEAR